MLESRKPLFLDEGQLVEDEHVASYKGILESETAFRSSKPSLGKSREEVTFNGAGDKLLAKKDEAEIMTKSDVTEYHGNGGAKSGLNNNKSQLIALFKKELMQCNLFSVSIRCFIFMQLWVTWLFMLAGTVTIILPNSAPLPSTPKTSIENGLQVNVGEISNANGTLSEACVCLFIISIRYEPLNVIESVQTIAAMTKEYGIKVIADLMPNYAVDDHDWFQLSAKKESPFTHNLVWGSGQGQI